MSDSPSGASRGSLRGAASSPSPAVRRPAGFAVRLMVAQALVLGAGAVTTWVVASVVGPGLFHDHLAEAGDFHTPTEVAHIEEAFGSALLISVAVALLASVAAALAVSWYFSRRVQRSIGTVTDAAAEIAAGRFDTRVPAPGIGAEFETLAGSYNTLASRLETVETTRRRMLADLAHEMRTPLATVEAHLEAIEDGVRELDADTLAVLRASTGRLRRLAEDVSAVSRAEEGNLELQFRRLDAADVTRSAATALESRYAGKGVELRTDLTAAAVVGDADRLAQVLTNLLDNALAHTPPGGTVTVTCQPMHAGDTTWVQYSVTDTGDGIAAEHLPHLFDRFYRVDTARDRGHGGAGIGLAITRALVEAHDGIITVASDGPGHGATFTMRLPASTTPSTRG
ncbi:sensor histidine kinase [Nocardioides caldifontis]|uniref:sensor histidine kinase n=1 Tax=Nocardioides caldifontis TaxID=2588938 RepID=UPI001EF07507|nr:HAMP domain-containing sensor histidine kinase [Nocardioides caldifontis]